MEKRALLVLFSMSDDVRGEYAEEEPLGVKKIVNEVQIHRLQVLFFSGSQKQSSTTEPYPLRGLSEG